MLSVMRTRTRVQPLCWASETALTKQLILEHGNVKLHTMLPTRAWFHPSRFQVFFFQLLNVLFASIFSRFPEGFCKKNVFYLIKVHIKAFLLALKRPASERESVLSQVENGGVLRTSMLSTTKRARCSCVENAQMTKSTSIDKVHCYFFTINNCEIL